MRSLIDIGPDTGVYLDLGKKVARGGKYYYDFFESNFPISFYFYALQYQIASLLHLNTIILCEIVINLLAVLSILWSAKILKLSTISDNKAHYNLLIISYFLGFFLRPIALPIGEFGTKTSLLLIALYPYLSYSFVRKINLTKKDLIYRGCLMGLIPCIKPHYLILIVFVELNNFYRKKSFKEFAKFFFEIDKLLMLGIGSLYIFLMLKFTPEFFEFIVPMWPKIYNAYDNSQIFLNNLWQRLASQILPLSFILLVFSRFKLRDNDRILLFLFIGASLLLALENIGTIDQVAMFYAIATICFSKFLFDFLFSEKFSLLDNKFIVGALFFLPLSDLDLFPAIVFGLGGFVNILWMVIPIYSFLLIRKFSTKFTAKFLFASILIYFASLLISFSSLRLLGDWPHLAINLFFLFLILFFLERKIYPKFSEKFSPLSIFVITTAASCLFYSYVTSITQLNKREGHNPSPNKLSDSIFYYSKKYDLKKDDGFVTVSIWIAHEFPMINYLGVENHQKFHIALLQANQGTAQLESMFPSKNNDKVFTLSYFFDDMKNQLKNPRVKLLFFNNSPDVLNKENNCLIGSLEYYLLDPEFKKLFFQNFRFENHILITKKVQPLKKVKFITREEPSIFDQIPPTTDKILQDFEVYVRKDNEKN